MVYGDLKNVKQTLGQNTSINDQKIIRCQIRAYNFINAEVTNIETVIPIPSPSPFIIEFEENLACAYFWQTESGDTITAPSLEQTFRDSYKRNAYNRPKTISRCY